MSASLSLIHFKSVLILCSEFLIFSISETKNWVPTLLGLIVLVEEAYQKNGMNEVCEHQIPEWVIITDHGHPEEESHSSRAAQTVQVLRGKAFWVTILIQMNQLRNQRDCLDEHGEGDEHLEGQEVLALLTRVKNHWKDEAACHEDIPLQVYGAGTLVDRVFEFIAQVDDVAVKNHCCEDFYLGDP